MTTRFNTIILATIVAATAAVGVAGTAALGADPDLSGKGDRLFSATIDQNAFATVEYRGPQISVLARVPLNF